MSDGAFPDRLTQLKSRWDADPTSRVFLQLAEEYRHQGRVKEALEVLDRGLREHPGYLSALVAKGRCHLELGEPEPARAVLERVVKQDATQMVANKLLVRAYLDTGEPDRARERLDLYTLLNDSDPEIEELRRRLRAMEQPPQPPPTSDSPFPDLAPPAPPRPEAAAPARAAARGAAGGEDIFDLGFPAPAARPVAAPVADEPFADLWKPPAPVAPAPAAAATAPAAVAVAELEEEEPEDVIFRGLASRESRSRYLRALAAEGLFAFDLTGLTAETAAAPAPPPPSAAPAVFEPEPEPEPIMAFHEESAVEVVEDMEPALEEPALAEPAAAVAGFSWEVAEEPAPIAAPEPEPEPEAPVFEIEERTPWAVEPEPVVPEPAILEAAPVEPVAPAPPPAPAAGPAATVTLGELYLRQDHPGEAKRIFEEVLRREPDNAAAREALAQLAAGQRPLAARDLLAGYEPGEEGGEAEAKARKVFLLNSYLKRLRRGGQRDVS
jgi:tetratricopeptide (TPR) repeat protein